MSYINNIVVSNYYPDPHLIRNEALSLEFSKRPGARYPGAEAFSSKFDWELVRVDIGKYINFNKSEEQVYEAKKNFKQGKFRLALDEDNQLRDDAVHVDMQRYSAIVYLSRDIDCRGGIGLYKCKYTNEYSDTDNWCNFICDRYVVKRETEEFFLRCREHMSNWDNWHKIGEIPMRFNQLTILMARAFHASTGIFGNSRESGRLTQHFEYYV
jgi:hypothetical protein